MKEQDKSTGVQLSEVEISNLSNKEFKVMIIKMLIEFGRKTDEHSENFNKEIENIRKYQLEVKIK